MKQLGLGTVKWQKFVTNGVINISVSHISYGLIYESKTCYFVVHSEQADLTKEATVIPKHISVEVIIPHKPMKAIVQ